MEVRSTAVKPSRLLLMVYAAALLHVAVLAVGWRRAAMSNVVQLLVVLLAVAVCWARGRATTDRYLRRAWFQLGSGLAIYAAAQAYFTWMLLLHKPIGPRSTADFVWMMFPFPILLVTALRRSGRNGQWADWMDAAQACLFYALLYMLVFSRSAAFSSRLAFELQSVALVLSWLIRFSGAQEGAERRFFGDLGRFLVLYGLMSSLGNRWEQIGLPGYSFVGVCWSAPLLYFTWLALRDDGAGRGEPAAEMKPRWNLPQHLHGLSALGLSVMSLTAAAELELHHPLMGMCSLVMAFLIFAVRTCIRESQLHGVHDTMAHAVMHDALTGLANRTRLMAELDRVSEKPTAEVALLFLDLDRFKFINDSLGHAMGDRFLMEAARILRTAARPGDTVGRLGGDEFVIIVPGLDAAAVQRYADTVVHLFRQPVSIEGKVLHVSVSVGYAMRKPGLRGEALLREADAAMYAAKKRGKNQAQFFLGGVQDDAERALRLETDLRAAVGTSQIEVHFQPIYSLKRRRINGFEALVRWRHPERGLVSPGEFIPLAKETGLILELGAQVLRRGCEQVERWSRRFGERFTVSVNVSGRQFADPELLGDVKEILRTTGLPPELLKMEITESMLLSGTVGVAETLAEVRGLGIGISLDDFLTGYSSMSYLLEYPCDVVKIDRSFVRSVDKDARRAELVRTVVQLAENLEMSVIAEGVETREELALLEQVGCDYIQGYLFSRPLPPAEVEALLSGDGSWGCPVEQAAGVSCHEVQETTPGFA